jgi:hypothetical protein
MPRERLTCATRPTAARLGFWMNVKGHGGAVAAEAEALARTDYEEMA